MILVSADRAEWCWCMTSFRSADLPLVITYADWLDEAEACLEGDRILINKLAYGLKGPYTVVASFIALSHPRAVDNRLSSFPIGWNEAG